MTRDSALPTAAPSERTVLLVEDDPGLSTLVGSLLDEAGYRPVAIADHSLIGAAIERWQPRCVILDGEVPEAGHGRSWHDAVAIRRAHPDLPVLMFTADKDTLTEARAGTSRRSRAAGFAGVVGKPFVVEEFLATVRRVVDESLTTNAAPSARHQDAMADAITVFPDISAPPFAERAEMDFFSTAVHELRTPLTSISGQVQLARRLIGLDLARERQAIDRALTQVERMTRLIAEMLDHARLAANALSLEVVTFDLGSAVADATLEHEHGDTKRIAVQRPDAEVRARGDPDRVAQILGNLLDNALKYSAPDTTIDVALTVVGREAQVRVTDRGVGVPASERDLLFTPYYRTSRTRAIPGSGLGLHISRQLAERHGGRLWLDASAESGSVFALALPLA